MRTVTARHADELREICYIGHETVKRMDPACLTVLRKHGPLR